MSDIVERLFRWSKFGYGVDASCDMVRAADTITTLRAQLAKLEDDLEFADLAISKFNSGQELQESLARENALRAQVERLEADKAKLREAVLPFADEADRYDDTDDGEFEVAWDTSFPIGTLRRARLALAETGEKP